MLIDKEIFLKNNHRFMLEIRKRCKSSAENSLKLFIDAFVCKQLGALDFLFASLKLKDYR